MGARAYNVVDNIEFLPGEIAVEIGSERGEGSTSYLREKTPEFYSVDVAPTVPDGVIRMDGAEFLRGITKPIKFAYLDNFDWIPEGLEEAGFIREQVIQYAGRGVTMNNENSQLTHLEQAKLVAEKAAPGCVILIDDTFKTSTGYSGKGGMAVPWLIEHGYRLLNTPADQFDGGYALLKREDE